MVGASVPPSVITVVEVPLNINAPVMPKSAAVTVFAAEPSYTVFPIVKALGFFNDE